MGGKLKKIRLQKPGKIRTWQLVLILIPLLFVVATLLRLDHIKMTELRAAVLAADEFGDDAEIEQALRNLQDFTFSHIIINITEENGLGKISFGTGPFYLEHQYRRAAEKALAEAEKNFVEEGNPNGNVYAKAGEVCSRLARQNGWKAGSEPHLNCVFTELAKYPASDQLSTTTTISLPSTELYRLNYSSPLFAPTPSGFALLAAALLIIIIIIRLIFWLILEISLLIFKKIS